MDYQKLFYIFSTLSELGEEVTSVQNFQVTIRSALHMILGALSITRGAILARGKIKNHLVLLAHKGLKKEDPMELSLPPEVETFFLNHEKVFLSGGRNKELRKFFGSLTEVWPRLKTVLGMPLTCKGDLVGLICLGPKLDGSTYSPMEKNVLTLLGHHIANALHSQQLIEALNQQVKENMKLVENLRYIYDDTIRAFAAAIDAKDPYTKGHSYRVALYAVAIGRELGYGDDVLEGFYVAGLLHDVGKIIVDKDIINKKKHLSSKEFGKIMEHTQAGYQILSAIRFPWSDVPLMAKSHHEKLDGHGYPEGLHGDQIADGAKIICLADAFDAMTSHRPYRHRLSFERTVKEIKKNINIQFEKRIVKAFFSALKKEIEGKLHEQKIIPNLDENFNPQVIHSFLELTIAELS
jgi:HD-GYP domain-containing protein (c-di-GMP phosphodiesterase class II)